MEQRHDRCMIADTILVATQISSLCLRHRMPNRNQFSSSSFLAHDWEKFGAEALRHQYPLSVQESSRYCRTLALSHYENFSVASWLIPAHLRVHFFHVYAYCRWSDDLADESATPQIATERLDWWQSELNACFQGKAIHPVMIALRETVKQFQLSQKPFDDLLSAFRQDQIVRRYADDSAVEAYCERSANPVGRIVLGLAGVNDDRCLKWSDQICTGLQIANFCQDMKRDATLDRIYLPMARWAAPGIDESTILGCEITSGLQQALASWTEYAQEFFFRGWPLAEHVPGWLARDIRLFVGGGMSILHTIRRNNFDVWTRRLEVTKPAKLLLLMKALLSKKPPARIPFDFPASASLERTVPRTIDEDAHRSPSISELHR